MFGHQSSALEIGTFRSDAVKVHGPCSALIKELAEVAMLKLPVLHHRQGPIVFLFQVLSSSGGRRAVCAWIISVDDGNAGGPDQAADGI